MLTRLKVSGFKNLVDVDVQFGPFTCVAGANGVGKSNLFDAIRFLSALADRPLIDAALSVRDEGGRTTDVRSLFHRVGDQYDEEMSFEVEMIVPKEGVDDLGQEAKATITFLRYTLRLAYRADDSLRSLGSLELLEESLSHITRGDARKHLPFPHKAVWRDSALSGKRFADFISTEGKDATRVVKLHQDSRDGKGGGRPSSRLAASLPRTVLSVANAAESPTALLARREMQSWRLLQLEPSALRKPDEFTAPVKLGADGSHLPATLYHLGRMSAARNGAADGATIVYSRVANRLAELIDDVYAVGIDYDERRELLTLEIRGRDGTPHPARALSDGTLRFLALSVLELDPEAQGVLCLEEPENGIHPERIQAMLHLLQDIATNVNEATGPDNPLRQVIVNTHSPAVVGQVPDDSLLVAELKATVRAGQRFKRVCFSGLPDTWRAKVTEDAPVVAKGQLLSYLNPVVLNPETELMSFNGQAAADHPADRTRVKTRRVIDRPDIRQLMLFDS